MLTLPSPPPSTEWVKETTPTPSWRSFAPWRWRAYGRRSDRLFMYISRKLLEWEARYNTVEKECLAIWWPPALLPYVRVMPRYRRRCQAFSAVYGSFT